MPVPVTLRVPGVVGAVTSGAVVPVIGALWPDTLPEGSIAWTWKDRV